MSSLADGECSAGGDDVNDVLNSPHCFNAANTIILIEIPNAADDASMRGDSLTTTEVSGGAGHGGAAKLTGPGNSVLQDGSNVIEIGQSPEELRTADVSAAGGLGGPRGIMVGVDSMREILEQI